MGMMDNVGTIMGGMGLLWLLLVILLVLGIVALAKYVFGGPRR
jgi:flagellar basal body-associated protein FliL